MSIKIQLSGYRDGVKGGCRAMHKVSQASHKTALSHLYGAVSAMESRCLRLEDAADSQFKAMGEDLEWSTYWKELGLNPYAPDRSPIRPRPTLSPHSGADPVISNEVPRGGNRRSADGEHEKLVTLPPLPRMLNVIDKPDWMNSGYDDFCELQGMAYHQACCTTVLFDQPDAHSLHDINCTKLIIPERMEGTPYFRPLYVSRALVDVIERTGSLDELRAVYLEMARRERVPREKRQIIPLAIAGGAMFATAVNSVLGFFGYSTTTTNDVKHINANQKHLLQVEHHVAQAEEFASKMRDEAHDLANKELMVERFLHISTSLQGVFEHYELLMQGLSVLFHNKHLSPLLVDRKSVMTQVRALATDEATKGNTLLINPLDVWKCKLSYIVTKDMDVVVMVHLPVGKITSYRNLFEYRPTPLAFQVSGKHFFPNPTQTYLLLDKDNNRGRTLSEAELAKCEAVEAATRYCPAATYELNESPPTCLSALHQGDTTGVLAMCTVSMVDERFVYISSLGFGVYSLYTKERVKARVLCGDYSIAPMVLEGLNKVTVRKDCRVVGEDFILEPLVDYSSLDHVLDEIPIMFAPDQNFTEAINWGSENGKIPKMQGPGGATMLEIAKAWDNTVLDESTRWGFMVYVGIGFAVVLGIMACCCGTKEIYHCYGRRRERKGLVDVIRTQMMELAPLNQGAETVPTAPSA